MVVTVDSIEVDYVVYILTYLRSSDQEIDCADIGISAPSAKLI